jgi:probable F420-dependent oxidoreductase
MNIGIVFPQTEFGNDPSALRDFTQTVEELGYTHVLAYEHVLGADPSPENSRANGWEDEWRGPYTYRHPFHEPFLLFSFMAALTTRLSFVTGILILPQRQAALVAKQAAELDVLCGGRLRLGIGVGWNKVEMAALGEDPATRGRRADEQLEVLQALWTQPLVTFDGRWHRMNGVGINPLPVQQPIPLWFGGHAGAVVDRLARLGSGWLPGLRQADHASAWLEQLDSRLAFYGRSRAEIGIEPRLSFKDGTPEIWGQTLEGWRQEGAQYASIITMGCGFEKPAQHLQALQTFAAEMGLKNG